VFFSWRLDEFPPFSADWAPPSGVRVPPSLPYHGGAHHENRKPYPPSCAILTHPRSRLPRRDSPGYESRGSNLILAQAIVDESLERVPAIPLETLTLCHCLPAEAPAMMGEAAILPDCSRRVGQRHDNELRGSRKKWGDKDHCPRGNLHAARERLEVARILFQRLDAPAEAALLERAIAARS